MDPQERRMGIANSLAEAWPEENRFAALIARTVNGEEDALAALYDATAALVHGLALRILGDRGAAEEVTADVYLQVWRQAVRYDATRGTPLAWLLMLGRSRAIDRLRARAGRGREVESLRAAEALPSGAPGPDEDAALAQRRGIVAAALARLSPEQRTPIALAYYAGRSHSEIAAVLGLPLGTVKTRIRLGMTRLREALAAALAEAP
jgi:RNA polymerase sigma-70 factor (ECF subfamily)